MAPVVSILFIATFLKLLGGHAPNHDTLEGAAVQHHQTMGLMM
jgi:hypothetical protein